MRFQFKRSIFAIGTAVVLATSWSARSSVVGQSGTTYKTPRTVDGQPNLNGFWQVLNTANWDLEDHPAQAAPFQNLVGAYLAQPAGLSVVEGGTIPYKPEALAKRKRYFEGRLRHDPILADNLTEDTADPEAKCFQGGVPRANYLPFPFQILQTKNKVLIAYEYAGSPRMIYLGQDLAKTRADLLEIDAAMGQSVGRFEGDTLVVDTRWFSYSPQWLDRAGNFMSEKAVVVERYTPTSPHHLNYEATITDPDVFTRPWKISMPLYRRIDPNMQLLEFRCVPFAEEFLYGSLVKKPAAK